MLKQLKHFIVQKETLETLDLVEEVNGSLETCDDIGSSIFTNIIQHVNVPYNVVVGPNVLSDLEIIQTYNGCKFSQDTIFGKLFKSSLQGSKYYFAELLTRPNCDINILKKRQSILAAIDTKIKGNLNTKQSLQTLKENEKSLLWIYQSTDQDLQSLYDLVYFKFWMLKMLNHKDIVLTGHNLYKIIVSPLIGILTPITYFVIPYLIVRIKFKLKVGFIAYIKMMFNMMFSSSSMFGSGFSNMRYLSYCLSIIFYFQGLFNSVEVSKAVYKISSLITEKTYAVAQFIKTAKQMQDIFWDDDILNAFFEDSTIALPNVNYFEAGDVGSPKFKLFSNFGKSLKIYKHFKKEMYIPLIKRCYMIDTLIGILDAKDKLKLGNVEFVEGQDDFCEPKLSLCKVWHPSLDQEKAVGNDVMIGETYKHIILTGPNAGGKSTLIKSVLLTPMLSQTICFANAESCRLTPFHYMNSQINIPDCKGKESLFEAEMNRSLESLQQLQLFQDKPTILVMDEIFNSTNPIEGIAGAYAIAKRISEFKNNVSIISTHFIYLTKLAKRCPSFAAFKMNVSIQDDTTFSYPYKLSRGVSRQYIALELLKRSGFEEGILDDAIKIKNELLRSSDKKDKHDP